MATVMLITSCDICETGGKGAFISAAQMREAVFDGGFDPFALGLSPARSDARTDYYAWKTNVVAFEVGDWSLCERCQAAVRHCFSGEPDPIGIRAKDLSLFFSSSSASTCRQCGARVKPDFRFCMRCGLPQLGVSAQRPPETQVEGEASTKQTDDGLRALARRDGRSALAIWRELVDADSEDPEPYLFYSELLRARRDWLSYGVAVKFSEKACVLDPSWPEAWLSVAEWHLRMALNEGVRRGRLFKVDRVLRELGTFDRVVECYVRTAELDDGRLASEIEEFTRIIFDPDAQRRIADSTGLRSAESTSRLPTDLLRRAGLTDDELPAIPSDGEIVEDVKAILASGAFLVFIPDKARLSDFREMLQREGLTFEPAYGFKSVSHFEEWYNRASKNRFVFISPAVAATWECDWFQPEIADRVTVVWLGAESLSLSRLLGGLLWTSPTPERRSRVKRMWYSSAVSRWG